MEFHQSTGHLYAPIAEAGEIRLVCIHPATSLDAPVICHLELFQGFDQYCEALSTSKTRRL
jgi:hypothetical protein